MDKLKIPQDLRGNPLERAGFLPYAYPALTRQQGHDIAEHLETLIQRGGLQDRIQVRLDPLTYIVTVDAVNDN